MSDDSRLLHTSVTGYCTLGVAAAAAAAEADVWSLDQYGAH